MENEIRPVNIIGDAQNIINCFLGNCGKPTRHKDIKIDSPEALNELQKFYKQSIIRNCKRLDCKWAAVVCYYIISRASYNKHLAESKIHLICQKAVSYMLLYGKDTFNTGMQSADLVNNILADISNLMVLESANVLYDFLPEKKELKLVRNQIILTGKQVDLFNQYNITMSGRGTRQRFSNTSTRFFLENRQEFITGIENMINQNRTIREIELFKHTVYQYLPDCSEETASFWKGLLHRVRFIDKLLVIIAKTALVTKFRADECLDMLFSFKTEEIEDIKECILCKQDTISDGNVAFSYPLVHIAPGFYATSFNIFGDSINAYIERNIYYNFRPDGQRVGWADKVCQSLAKEFEDKVIDKFSQHGFTVGEVTAKGAWKANNMLLTNQDFEKIPGQIDALAVKDNKIYVVECKMYNDINDFSRIKTVNNLFDVTYGKNIIKAIVGKLEFMKGSNIYTCIQGIDKDLVQMIPLIVTDIPLPVFSTNNSGLAKGLMVTDFASLNTLLKE